MAAGGGQHVQRCDYPTVSAERRLGHTEIPHLLHLSGWPDGMRVIVCKKALTPAPNYG